MKIKTTSVTSLGVLILVVLVCFLSPLQQVLSQNSISICYISGILLLVLELLGNKKKLKKVLTGKNAIIYLIFVLFSCCYFFNNQYWRHNNLGYFMIGTAAIFILLILSCQRAWIKTAFVWIKRTAFIHVVATFFFFAFPALWSKYAYPIFGTYIPGTGGGTKGYTAGLNGHYSTNATLVTIAALCTMISLLCSGEKERKKHIRLLMVEIIAILLTQKRAHILFFALTFVMVYTFYNWKRGALKTMFKLIGVCVVGWFAVEFIIAYIPMLGQTFARFQTVGKDAQTLTRFTMWQYAWDLFKKNKILGVGWGGYRYLFENLNMFEGAANAHNIYIQLLAETGIVGFCCFMGIAIIGVTFAIKGLLIASKANDQQVKKEYLYAATFQIFMLLYGLTGNVIYDFCFVYYAFSVAASVGLMAYRRKEKK